MAKSRTATGWSGGKQFAPGSVEVQVGTIRHAGFHVCPATFPGQCAASGLRYPMGTTIAFGPLTPGTVKKDQFAVIYPQSNAAIVVARMYLKRNQPIATDCLAALKKLPELPPDIQDALKGKTEEVRELHEKGLNFKPDRWQQAAIDSFMQDSRHLMVVAGAGSGKSTFQRACIKLLFEARKNGTAPAWAMKKTLKVGVFMFNAANRTETNQELRKALPNVQGASCAVYTFHAYGLGQIRDMWSGKDTVRVAEFEKRDLKLDSLLRAYQESLLKACDTDERGMTKLVIPGKELTHRAKIFLASTEEEINKLIDETQMETIDLMGGSREKVVRLAYELLKLTLPESESRTQFIDVGDMLHWLATKQEGLDVEPFDLVMVDEAQDVGADKIEICRMLERKGARLIVVGDPAQAINGFTGAFCDAMDRIKEFLETTRRGCVSLPMPVNRRCSKSVIREANTVGYGWENLIARDKTNSPQEAPEGSTGCVSRSLMFQKVQPGDAIISRVNSEVLSAAIGCLEVGLPFRILGGKDAAKEIVGVLEQATKKRTIPIFGENGVLTALDEWCRKQEERLGATPGMAMALSKMQNHVEALKLVAQKDTLSIRGRQYRLETSEDMIKVINALVMDEGSNKDHAVNIMTAHKSKGGEFNNVYNITPELFPHPKAEGEESIAQEFHLLGVTITRAKLGYYICDDWNPEQGEE